MQPFAFNVRVYTEDTDFGGLVYHPNYLKFMERARTEWASSNGIDLVELANQGTYFVVRAAKVEYLKPARMHDELQIITCIAKVGRVSIIYQQVIQDAKNHEHVYCTGEIVVVCINQQMKPQSLPEHLLKVIQA